MKTLPLTRPLVNPFPCQPLKRHLRRILLHLLCLLTGITSLDLVTADNRKM